MGLKWLSDLLVGHQRLDQTLSYIILNREISQGTWKKIPLMSASSRADSRINQDRSDETRNTGNSEDGDFTVLRPNCDRHSHAHHKTV